MRLATATLLILTTSVLSITAEDTRAEDIFREAFDDTAHREPLIRTWGEAPSQVLVQAIEPDIGHAHSPAAHVQLQFPDPITHSESYWNYRLPNAVPLVPQVETLSFRVKTNVPVCLKVALAPYGFIYHGPRVQAAEQWQQVTLAKAYDALKKWCEDGGRTAQGGWISDVIVAIGAAPGVKADLVIDDLALEGSAGAAAAVATETFRRQTQKIRIVPISLVWDQGYRTLENTLNALDEAGLAGADLACLPQECVLGAPQPIPGPTAGAIAKKAAEHKMYIVGNLRERDGEKTYVTSFLCDRPRTARRQVSSESPAALRGVPGVGVRSGATTCRCSPLSSVPSG